MRIIVFAAGWAFVETFCKCGKAAIASCVRDIEQLVQRPRYRHRVVALRIKAYVRIIELYPLAAHLRVSVSQPMA